MRTSAATVLALMFTVTSNAACSPRAIDCIYIPRSSAENPEPELMPHPECGTISNDRLVLAPEHLGKLSFSDNGLASVFTKEGTFYVDKSGRSVRTYFHDMGADDFRGGLARGIVGNKFGFINESLDFVINPVFDFAFPFTKGYAIVCNGCERKAAGEHWIREGGVWGVIDKTGEIVIPLEYSKETLKQTSAYKALGL